MKTLLLVVGLGVLLLLVGACGGGPTDEKCREAHEKANELAFFADEPSAEERAEMETHYRYLEENCTLSEDGEIVAK